MSEQEPAAVFLCQDSTRSPAEGRFYAEVVRNAGWSREETLHTTGWFGDPRSALQAAEAWMRKRGVPDQED